ncbi:RES domain-containing protein [Acinetobacter calcoaceticus]|uniref:RES domain-containing protein n=1 Tax=Acinetobacter calcoaceticus TaxID=471 RepID=UPI0032B33635
MEKFCCPNCFTEKNIARFINEKGSFRGSCNYCESENINTINPKLVFDFIEKFDFGLESGATGLSLFEILEKKIYFFEDQVIDKYVLFKDIISDHLEILEKKYIIPDSKDIQLGWEVFSEEIKTKNRFFPQTELYKQIFTSVEESDNPKANVFNVLVESLTKTYSDTRSFFRARVNDKKLPIKEMKAPPSLSVTAGRANPIGIPYLYLAENEKTCVAEVRPSNGCLINLAVFRLKAGLSILDLTCPRKKASFLIQESESLTDTLIYVDLLEIFANELSKPVLPNRSHLDYIPTQFLCEYFKTICGFNGLIFNSSFGSGINLVLFDQNLVDDVSIKYITVSNIEHTFFELK